MLYDHRSFNELTPSSFYCFKTVYSVDAIENSSQNHKQKRDDNFIKTGAFWIWRIKWSWPNRCHWNTAHILSVAAYIRMIYNICTRWFSTMRSHISFSLPHFVYRTVAFECRLVVIWNTVQSKTLNAHQPIVKQILLRTSLKKASIRLPFHSLKKIYSEFQP